MNWKKTLFVDSVPCRTMNSPPFAKWVDPRKKKKKPRHGASRASTIFFSLRFFEFWNILVSMYWYRCIGMYNTNPTSAGKSVKVSTDSS